MRDKIEILGLIVLSGVIIWLISQNRSLQNERDLYKTKIENDFKTKYTAIEQQLRESQRQRTILFDSLNTRNIHIQTLNRVSDSLTTELKSIKGRYNKLSSSEKAKEMEKRANN